jgi:hypothetical protein
VISLEEAVYRMLQSIHKVLLAIYSNAETSFEKGSQNSTA